MTTSLKTASVTDTFIVLRGDDEVELTVALWLDVDGEVETFGAFDPSGEAVALENHEQKAATSLLLDLAERRYQDAQADAW